MYEKTKKIICENLSYETSGEINMFLTAAQSVFAKC